MFDIMQTQLEGGILVYPSILALLILFAYLIYRLIRKLYPKTTVADDEAEFNQLLSDAGYSYDPAQDIFYSKMDAWQRKYGYCRLYDEAAAPSGMILDSEPVHFEYAGKRWLIEFWKGQYGLNTGGEVGVYYSEEPDLAIPDFFNGTFYQSVSNGDRLDLAFVLYKNGREFFRRGGKHWWLTGFKPGEFSDPSELAMRIWITFKDTNMCWNFVRALKRIGYTEHEFYSDGIMVELFFNKPHTQQPVTRNEETSWIIQKNNERLCERYQEITKDCISWPQRLRAIREKEPTLFGALINIGKTKQIFKAFDKLKSFI